MYGNTQNDIDKALSTLNNSSVNDELNSLLQKLESKTIDEILKMEENDEIRRIDNEIREIITRALHLSVKTEDGKVQKIAELIFTEQSYLKRGIESVDVKLILIFLCVNCYLQIDIKSILTKPELSEESTQLISEKITEFLQKINIDVHALPDAPYHEIEMMKKFQQGTIDNDIKNTYQFIESIERGGRGFHFNFLLEHLIFFLYQLNYFSFLKHISKIENPQNFIFHLQSFKIESLLRFADAPSLTNKWLNFELIRQIIEKEQKGIFEENEYAAIKNALEKIDSVDSDFFKQTIQYFHRSKLFNAALGELLISFSDSKIQEILSDCFVIDRYNNNYEFRKQILERFENNASKQQMNILLKTIYEKWHSYFNSLLNSDDFYLNDVLLTDFCDFIVLYYIRITPEKEIINQMSDIINQLIWIDSQWFVSESKQLTTFHLLYSKLYLLSFAYKEKHLKDTCITTIFSKMKCDNVLLNRYFRDNEFKSLAIIEENLK